MFGASCLRKTKVETLRSRSLSRVAPSRPAPAVVGHVVDQDVAGSAERLQRHVLEDAVEDLEARTGGEVEDRHVRRRELELAVDVRGELGFDRRLVLQAEVVAVAQLQCADDSPVGLAERLLVEVGGLAEQLHARSGRSEVGVGLVAQADEGLGREHRGLLLRLHLRHELLGAAAHVGRQVGRFQRTLEVGARHFEGAEPVIEHAELEAHARQVGVDQEHALQCRDRPFEVAGLGRDGRELEQHVEIGGLLQHSRSSSLAGFVGPLPGALVGFALGGTVVLGAPVGVMVWVGATVGVAWPYANSAPAPTMSCRPPKTARTPRNRLNCRKPTSLHRDRGSAVPPSFRRA